MTDRAELPSVLANLHTAAQKMDAELHLQRDLKAAGLLGFVRGREFAFASARCRRNFRFDFSDVERRLAIEVQGGGWMRPDEKGNRRGAHGTGAHIERDCEKATLAAALGWTVLYVTPTQIKKGALSRLAEAVAVLREIAGAEKEPCGQKGCACCTALAFLATLPPLPANAGARS